MNDISMLGVACGDIAGSIYEWKNYNNEDAKYRPEVLIEQDCRFTDDTAMSCAVAQGLMNGLENVNSDWMNNSESEKILFDCVQQSMRYWGNKYIDAGYGGSFIRWLQSDDPQPYGSWANGSAMRVSFAGRVALSLEEAEKLAEITASVTHNHPLGIAGAKAVAGCVYLLLEGKSKSDILDYARKYYDMNFTLDEIRDEYKFDVSCQGSVPQAIKAFLEEDSFSDVISAAISIGGDSDTIAAIAGALAEVCYPIDEQLKKRAIDKLPEDILGVFIKATEYEKKRTGR